MAKFGFKAAPTAQVHTPAENNNVEISREGDIAIELDLSLIDFDPLQHRQEIDDAALDELAKSIETHNVIHSILVRPATPAGRYPLVVGERRCKASLRAGKKTIPAIVRQLTDLQADAIQLIENAQREGVNPLHTAQKLGRMLKDHNIKHIELAELIGKSETYITQHLRLLELPPEVAEVAESGAVRDVDTLTNLAKLTELNPEAATVLLDKSKAGEKITRADSRDALKDQKEKIKVAKDPSKAKPAKPIPAYPLEIIVTMNKDSEKFNDFITATNGGRAKIDFTPILLNPEGRNTTARVLFESTGEKWDDIPLSDLTMIEMSRV